MDSYIPETEQLSIVCTAETTFTKFQCDYSSLRLLFNKRFYLILDHQATDLVI